MSKYLLECVDDGELVILSINKLGEVFVKFTDSKIQFTEQDSYKYVTCILAGFEETGFRFIKEL